MRYPVLIYIVVAIIAASLARFKADVYSWFLVLEFFVGFTQIVASIVRSIVSLSVEKRFDRIILQYWFIVAIYAILALFASNYYEAHITDPMFDLTISYNIVILSLAWPIAFWYIFNISFLKLKQL
jgi:hypothetical protein